MKSSRYSALWFNITHTAGPAITKQFIAAIILGFTATCFAELKLDIPPQLPAEFNCQASREYITALNYLRDRKDIGITEKQARKMADQISKGCTGSAQRFIRAFEVLNKVEIGAQTARDVALVLTQTTDEIAENFILIFTTSFVKNELDLSSQKSVELAKKLSYGYKGNFDAAKSDFNTLISFCKREDLGLALSLCGEFMVEVILESAHLGVKIGDEFVSAFDYLRSQPMLKASVTESMAVAKKVSVQGPRALENFTRSFEFAISDEGLAYNAQQALNHSLRMVSFTKDPRPPRK